MRSPLLFFLLCMFHVAKTMKNIVPAFIIDENGVLSNLHIEPNPFAKISPSHFGYIIQEVVRRSEVVIIFVEDNFSTEDIALKDKLGTPYYHLHQGILDHTVKYLPGVIEPYPLLKQVFQPQEFNVFYLTSGAKLQMFDGHFKYLYVYFQDGRNETRADTLRKHDLIMREVYSAVRQLTGGPVVALYTGDVNPAPGCVHQLTPVSPASGQDGVTVVTDGAIFHLVGVYSTTQTRRAAFNQVPVVAEQTWADETLSTTLAYSDFTLKFDFLFTPTSWTIMQISLYEDEELVGRARGDPRLVAVPAASSYYCDKPFEICNEFDDSAVTISEILIQPRWKRKIGDHLQQPEWVHLTQGKPGRKVVYCLPGAAWPAILFVIIILLMFLFIAMCFLMECRAYDRFDDPNGKPLIVATEG